MAVETPGMYRKDGKVYKVQIAVHGSGRPYAKVLLDGGGFDIARGMVRVLQPSDMMTLEEAKEYGALYGVCCVCGRTLTDEASIEAGIGPVCAKRGNFAAPGGGAQLYQTEESRKAALLKEASEAPAPAAPQTFERVLDAGSNRYGPLFLLSWNYNDPDFAKIKNVFRAYEWNLLHQKWDGTLKVWSASLTPDTVPVIAAFAKEFGFRLTPAAQAAIHKFAPTFNPEDAAPAVPQTFAQLAAAIR